MNDKATIHFRLLNDSHLDLMLHWFNTAHVQAFYSLRTWTYEEVCKKLEFYVRGENQISGFIIYLNKHPIGYIQSYPIKNHPWEIKTYPKKSLKKQRVLQNHPIFGIIKVWRDNGSEKTAYLDWVEQKRLHGISS